MAGRCLLASTRFESSLIAEWMRFRCVGVSRIINNGNISKGWRRFLSMLSGHCYYFAIFSLFPLAVLTVWNGHSIYYGSRRRNLNGI